MGPVTDLWAAGELYEPYIGRWSRLVAAGFVSWLGLGAGQRCVDVGCGTGALSYELAARVGASCVTGVDQSEGFVAYARRLLPGAAFRVGDATDLTFDDETFDAAVSGLVLNFVPDHAAMVREMCRVVKPGGTVAVYVWDYAGEMQLIRRFWEAAAALNPIAVELDEGRRFPVCEPGALEALFGSCGLASVRSRAIDVPTPFADFDDYWTPFLGAQGPAPAYVMSLDAADRERLRERLRESLPTEPDGSIHLSTRAWAVSGDRVG